MKEAMKIIFCIAVVAPCVALAQDKPASRIANGRPYDIRQYPFFARTFRNSVHYCGGALIANKFVATVAHCLEELSESDLPNEVRFLINSPANNNDWNN